MHNATSGDGLLKTLSRALDRVSVARSACWQAVRSWLRRPIGLKIGLVILALLFSPYVGRSVVKGKARTILLISALAPLLVVQGLSADARLWLLGGAIVLAPVQVPGLPIPYGLSLSELVLLLLVVVQLGLQPPGLIRTLGPRYAPYVLFASAGFISALVHGELAVWHRVCLVPLLLLISINNLVHTPAEALRLVRAAALAILGYFLILGLASRFGSLTPSYGSAMAWRLSAGGGVRLGPIAYAGEHSTTMGSLAALGVPAITVLLVAPHESHPLQFIYGTVLVLFLALVVRTAARGAAVAALASGLLAWVASGRILSQRVVVTTAVLALVAMIWGDSLLPILGQENLERLYTSTRAMQSGNLQARIATLQSTLLSSLRNPFGYGFGFLWHQYGVDEAIAYSVLINGTGLLGFIGFLVIMGQLLRHFAVRIRNGFSGARRDLAAIGLGTLVCGLIAGVSSESVVLNSVHSFVFWAILAATYWGTCCASDPRPEDEWQCLDGGAS